MALDLFLLVLEVPAVAIWLKSVFEKRYKLLFVPVAFTIVFHFMSREPLVKTIFIFYILVYIILGFFLCFIFSFFEEYEKFLAVNKLIRKERKEARKRKKIRK